MNFNLYIYGTPEGRYNQYPNDYTASLLEEWQKGAKGTRLVIYRKMNLVYYGYAEQLNNEGNCIGFCVVFNNARVLKPKLLIQFFKTIVEDYLVKSGDIIKYSEDGKIHYNLRAFNEGTRAFDKLKELISSEFDSNESKYGIVPLDSIYNGINSFETIDSNATDSQILALTNKHNKVIINDANGAEASYLNKLIANMKAENVSAKEKIKSLESEVEKVNRQKKQYKAVVTLFVIIILCCIGLLSFYREITGKTQHIQKLEKEITIKNDSLATKNDSLVLQTNKINSLKQELNNVTRFTNNTGSSIRNNDSSDSNWIMWVKANTRVKIISFYVKGGSSSNGEVVLAIYDSNDNLIATKTTNISSSEFKKVTLDDSWQLKRGTYYIRIKESNGKSLQYHVSNDIEYAQFTGGALEVTGCSSYSDRSNADSRNKHGYYQYFYNIQYEIVPSDLELNQLTIQ